MARNLMFYGSVLLVCGGAIAALLLWGLALYGVAPATTVAAPAVATLSAQIHAPLAILLLQMIVIVAAAKLVGAAFQRIGQPTVIGEIFAGVLLGPSLLGLLSPQTMGFLFPSASLGPLKLLSQIGVLLFMFAVGMEVDATELRRKAKSAVVISHTGIILPFFLGTLLALATYRQLAPADISFTGFALFMGIAMSITAFPVLMRILQERQLINTPLGQIVLTSAAIDDVTAWCLLALVIAIINAHGIGEALQTVALTLGFILVMYALLRPLAERLIAKHFQPQGSNTGLMTAALLLAMLSACYTEVIGIHAFFGAFFAGVIIPAQAKFRDELSDKLQTFCSVLLMPLFFAFTGLRTQIGLLATAEDWLLCGLIIAVAVAGKLCGGMFAARWTGSRWREAFAIGALMNTRGLMELIVLNIGYDLGILSPRVFTMLVIMALVTTFMTGPLLTLALRRGPKDVADAAPAPQK
jgi:Kef-type K+ transport system membrane component KefB